MKVINILHISDMHFSKKENTLSTAVEKDKSLSKPFISKLSSSPENQFLNDIICYPKINKFDFIACTGDIGFKGFKKNIELGVQYLKRLARTLNIDPMNVYISPGNHDLQRRSKPINQLKNFCDFCSMVGFKYADYNSSTRLYVQDIPIIILNTCLGGTEKAYYGYDKKDWEKLKDALKKDIRIMKEDLDIPAIGNDQLNILKQNIGVKNQGDFCIILMHHNPLPTNNKELRPYADIIDSGPFISYCIESEKHIIVLHGHTHCDSELTVAKYDIKGNQKGWVTAIGKKKFHHVAAILEIWLTDSNDFIKAKITDIEYNASKYNPVSKSILRSTIIPKYPDWINKIPVNSCKMKFADFAKEIGITPNEKLAIELLNHEDRLFDINMNGSNNYNNWTVGRI